MTINSHFDGGNIEVCAHIGGNVASVIPFSSQYYHLAAMAHRAAMPPPPSDNTGFRASPPYIAMLVCNEHGAGLEHKGLLSVFLRATQLNRQRWLSLCRGMAPNPGRCHDCRWWT